MSLSPQNPLGFELISYHILSAEFPLHDINFMAGESKIIGKKNSHLIVARELREGKRIFLL